ncbi:MAG: dihydrofolate reductase [Bdellovibrionota bacterium]
MISLIVAMDRNRVIGVENKLPWHLPADLKRFKTLTMGHHIIMGRKTYESIGKPLPGRMNVVVTRQAGLKIEGCKVVHSLEAAVKLAQGDNEAFIIGGAELFSQALEFVEKIYLTRVETKVHRGDTYFPEIEPLEWDLIEESSYSADEKNPFAYTYLTYLKKQ